MGEGNCLKYLKRGGTERGGEDPKIFKKGRGGASWVKGWVCQHPIHPIFYFMVYVLPLSHQHQPTMINTIGSR